MNKKKSLLFLTTPIVFALPMAIVSCSSNASFISEIDSAKNYDILWNTSFFNVDEEAPSQIFNLTIQQFEDRLNQQINSNNQNKKMIKAFAFASLYQAIKNPYNRKGDRVDITDEALRKFGDFLSDQMKPDNDVNEDSKKIYNNFDRYIEKINVRLNVLSFETVDQGGKKVTKINKDLLLGDVLNNVLLDRLHFQLSFKINDEKTNQMIVNNGESIFYRTPKNREEREIIKQNKNSEQAVKDLIENQFKYQGSKMYYDVANQEFKTIVLTSNVRFNGDKDTNPSGFIASTDTNRKMFFFDFKEIRKETFENYLIFDLANSAYFDPFLQTNFNNYLKKQNLYVDSKMKRIELDLQTSIKYKEFSDDNNSSS